MVDVSFRARRAGGLAVLLAAFILAVAPAVWAQGAKPTPARLTPADVADIRRIETYLNDITTMEARFLQVSSAGDYSEGDLYFKRPGRMRFEYDDPNPTVLVADGTYLAHYDRELQQVSYYGLDATQASFLLRENISFFTGDIVITRFERGAGVVRVTVIKASDPLAGNLTLIFSDRPLALRKWAVTDAQGVVTNVSLLGARFGVAIEPGLFVIDVPENTVQ